jgi:RNA polymerase sigma-54 factor
MAMLQRHLQSQRLQQKADPQLLLTNRLLQMSSLELQQCLTQELSENPALESGDEHWCGGCAVPGPQCADCAFLPASFRSTLVSSTRQADGAAAGGAREDMLDPLDLVEAPQTLRDHLLLQLRAAGHPDDWAVGRYLIDNIDHEGYLRCTEEEAARVLQVAPEEVERVLRLVQTFDPTGVGARSLQECLLIQARALAAEDEVPPHVEAILTRYWKELAAAKWRPIARGLRMSVEEVEQTVAWLRRNLSPYPGTQYRPSWEKNGHRGGQAIRPDVCVFIDEEDALRLEVVNEKLPELQLNPQYTQLWQQINERPDSFSAAERKHVREYILRAQSFLKSIQDRATILHRVAECMLEEQERYFRTERDEDMLPITQSQLASFLRVHESTVSRAIAEKFMQLPSGRVVPLSYFFDRALGLRRLVANVVASEDPSAPYSDQEIADILHRQGVVIARRTVMKYREELNILSSRQRARVNA